MREGGWKCLLEKGGGKAKWESLSRNGEWGGGGGGGGGGVAMLY